MKKNYSEEQIVKIAAELEAGSTVAQVSRKHGVHANSLYCFPRGLNIYFIRARLGAAYF
jgi:transposase-like protein